MREIITAIIGSIILGYAFGCINFSYILSKMNGFDIRRYGSGNAGASNITIVIGKKAGFFVAVLDILKAFLAVTLAQNIFKYAIISDINYAGIIAGVFSIIGHIAPFYMNFKGGKGLASLGGTILALDTKLFVAFLILAIIIAFVTDYICFVPITIVALFPIVYSYMHSTWIPLIIFTIAILLVWYRHIENIRRIRVGKELKFHFLWNRKSESERMGIADDGKSIFDTTINSEGIK